MKDLASPFISKRKLKINDVDEVLTNWSSISNHSIYDQIVLITKVNIEKNVWLIKSFDYTLHLPPLL